MTHPYRDRITRSSPKSRSFNSSRASSRSGGRSLPMVAVATVLTLAVTVAGCGSDDAVLNSTESDQLAFADDDQSSTTGDESSALAGSTTGSLAAEQGPVTTVRLAVPDSVDSIYQGRIGMLEPTTKVIDKVVIPPPTLAHAHPLTGLEGARIERPAMVVKIDNGAAVGPQTGLNAADIVIEEQVEGGVTRFAAIYQSRSSVVGPVRSGRTTDISLISSLGRPLFLYSGANDAIEGIIRRQPDIINHSYATTSGYWRDPNRQAPSDLYTDTAAHWKTAEARGEAPGPQFSYRKGAGPVDGEEAKTIDIQYPASPASWEWRDGLWYRSQRGEPHVLDDGEQVNAANVVIISAEMVDTGLVDANGGMVPEFLFVGTGPATVYTDGKRVDGTWLRPSLVETAELTDNSGNPIELTPGRTWIQLVST